MNPIEEQTDRDMRQIAFEQNHLTFRSLNQQMWQIPLISMTLTGGLWFGVSRVHEFPLFQLALLFLAAAGNFALIIIIQRLRFVMEQYLKWIEAQNPSGFVAAKGKTWYNRPFAVRLSFQVMLFLAFAISVILLFMTASEFRRENMGQMPDDPAQAYYEKHASHLADGYEALTFETAHPGLAAIMAAERATGKLRVLDVGAGTGRDAAWFAKRGHEVVAVEPSQAMRKVAKRLHAGLAIDWRDDRLPDLSTLKLRGETFDIIIASASWMHIRPTDRKQALRSIMGLLKSDGMLYLTLRLGPQEEDRGIHKVSLEDFKNTAAELGFQVLELESQSDLLGRPNIRWQAVRIDAS